jgi:HlyD family secretion protein
MPMSDTSAPDSGSGQPLLEGPDTTFDQPRKGMSAGTRWLIGLVLAAAFGAGAWRYLSKPPVLTATQFRTATVSRGDVIQEVTANGSLNPVKQVEVGSQVSGIIQKIYVDFNSRVKKDELLARIDPSTYQKNLAQAQAQLGVAKANLELAEISGRRADELFKDKLISASDHDTAVANLHTAQANLQIQEASLERANVDLGYTEVKSPIDGVVISRAVDEGQTVASSFNTPRLFVIANDLTKMQIEAAVSEADVGGVEENEPVSFSVDAFPNRVFRGQVQQVRFAPITNQNVVTYTAVIQVSNPDYKLRPGMTATAKIVVAQKNDVLRVPNAALRFRPPPGVTVEAATNSAAGGSGGKSAAVVTDSSGMPIPPWRAERRRPNPGEREKWEATLTPEQREKFQQMMQQMRQRFAEGGGASGGPGPGGPSRPKPEGPATGTVYMMAQGGGSSDKDAPVILRPVTVKTGATDGAYTEITDGLHEGDVVVTGVLLNAASAAEGPQNPFSPFGRRRR